ncbi:Starch-binding associating with outer membrane [Fodinibius roseus]|uniref:Starch-binding associating with outer membrane n=1 Tax=Fodinibius roseus TaxID=1194090 RepID=A0A1M5BL67_9BACT|nr:RagB/SusD family nutrient uptake outer membrane protein [Fodinibius roseus]SHF43294.1 Starch-binding associating with outer membrane [Fodinibius roseus]
MKNLNFVVITLVILIVSISSCTDLEENPVGLLAPESYFKTTQDAQNAVNGAYAELAYESLYGRKLPLTLSLLSDMGDIGDPGTASRRINLNTFTHDPNNGMISAVWPQFYRVISASNNAIDGIPSVEMDENRKNALIAEARFARALAYYHLVRLFGAVPYIDQYVEDPNSVNDIESTAPDQIYTGIIDDLEFGMDHLPDTHDGDIRSRATVGSAATMLASVYLTRENYDKAAEMAEFVIQNKDRFGYGLVDDYQELFNADNHDTREHIFTIDFLGGVTGSWPANVDYMAPITGIRDADQQGWSVLVPSMKVFNSFNDEDYRKEVGFQKEALIGGEMKPYTEYNFSRPHIAKYALFPGSNANANGSISDINYTVFRYAEVLLIAAEALNEINGGPTQNAYDYINQVRNRARSADGSAHSYPADLTMGLSQTAFRDSVMEERRIELSFEYKRWYDIVRRDMLQEVFTGTDALETRSVDPSKHYLLPLPQDELDRNPNLRPDGSNNGY